MPEGFLECQEYFLMICNVIGLLVARIVSTLPKKKPTDNVTIPKTAEVRVSEMKVALSYHNKRVREEV